MKIKSLLAIMMMVVFAVSCSEDKKDDSVAQLAAGKYVVTGTYTMEMSANPGGDHSDATGGKPAGMPAGKPDATHPGAGKPGAAHSQKTVSFTTEVSIIKQSANTVRLAFKGIPKDDLHYSTDAPAYTISDVKVEVKGKDIVLSMPGSIDYKVGNTGFEFELISGSIVDKKLNLQFYNTASAMVKKGMKLKYTYTQSK